MPLLSPEVYVPTSIVSSLSVVVGSAGCAVVFFGEQLATSMPTAQILMIFSTIINRCYFEGLLVAFVIF